MTIGVGIALSPFWEVWYYSRTQNLALEDLDTRHVRGLDTFDLLRNYPYKRMWILVTFSKEYILWSVGWSLHISGFFLRFLMKLVQDKSTKMTEPDFWRKKCGLTCGVNLHFGAYLKILPASLEPVIQIFWLLIFKLSSTLWTTLLRPPSQEKSCSCCLLKVYYIFFAWR